VFLSRIRSWRACVSLSGATAVVVAAILLLGSAGAPASARMTHANRLLHADSAALAATSPTIPAKADCSSLSTDPSFVTIPGNPTAIASATVVPASGSNPEYCDVKGMIAPQTHFELYLPTKTWQGRYLQNGCGGYCGTVSAQTFPSCDATLGGDFAMATDDEGHTASAGVGGAGLFAFNSEKLRKVYGYESEHSLYVVSKAIIGVFYGRQPTRTYYDGCSDGGREAMEMAERYPTDFNGIIAGAPEIIAGPLNAEHQTWDYKVNTDANGNAILTDNKLAALHAAVIAACGQDDGTNDGIITDPENCHFDPATIQCPAGQDTDNCLTPDQVAVVRKFYQGPADPQGRLLYPGGLPYGSELGWSVFELPPSQNGGAVPTTQSLDYGGLSLPYLRYQLLAPGRLGPDPSQWQFDDQGFRSMFPAANDSDAMSTDLWAFRAHGGKLIMWQGWSDNAIPPSGTVDYYDVLTQRMGGPQATQRFARLFMFPTVYHCGGGYANSSFDLVYPMVQWVENGAAPSQITATDTIGNATLTRPVYPYPEIPKYDASGNPDQAASFQPVRSAGAHYTNWIGNYLFHQPIGGERQTQTRARRAHA
jgi:tannase/feruloyl esterase